MAYRKGLLEFRCVAGAFSRVLHQRLRGLVVDPVFLEQDDDCQREKTEPDAARPPRPSRARYHPGRARLDRDQRFGRRQLRPLYDIEKIVGQADRQAMDGPGPGCGTGTRKAYFRGDERQGMVGAESTGTRVAGVAVQAARDIDRDPHRLGRMNGREEPGKRRPQSSLAPCPIFAGTIR